MTPYSLDLRERAVASVESGECKIGEAARRFKVSKPSLERWLAKKRTTGNLTPLPHAGGVPRKLAAAEKEIRAAVKQKPDATLQELCTMVRKRCKITADASMMCRELVHLKLPRKKNPSMPANVRHPA